MPKGFTDRLQELCLIAGAIVLGFWFAVYSLSSGCANGNCLRMSSVAGSAAPQILNASDFEMVRLDKNVESFFVKSSNSEVKARMIEQAS